MWNGICVYGLFIYVYFIIKMKRTKWLVPALHEWGLMNEIHGFGEVQ